MSSQVSSGSSTLKQSEKIKQDIVRRSANFEPSVWGDHFMEYNFDCKSYEASSKEIEELKEEVRSLIISTHDPSQKINLIDAIQRLGIAYHFERELEEKLEKIYNDDGDDDHDNLYVVSLRFRLLRQEGYKVSCDVFNKFKDEHNNFKGALISDVHGMLCLYEATHLRIHGEDILDEALAFTRFHLKSIVTHLRSPLSKQVTHALKQPLHKGIPRAEARQYISVYEEVESHNEKLLKLAKLDFNLLQTLYLKELSDISKWWKDLDFASKLPFARDRIVELYLWIVGVYFEPHYVLARNFLSKIIAMTSIFDDIYDVYGTIEELQLFTDAAQRMEINDVDHLPEYMKTPFQALLDVYNEMEAANKDWQSYGIYCAKEAMKKLFRAYLLEAKWFHDKNIPTMEEYMSVALVTSTYHMLTVTSFIGMGENATKEVFNWAMNEPKIIRASEIICRLANDIVSHEFEQKRGHAASAVECYMNQYGVSREKVVTELNTIIEDAWKDITEEFLKETTVSVLFLMRPFNLARVIDVMYKDVDEYTSPGSDVKDFISHLFVNPIPI